MSQFDPHDIGSQLPSSFSLKYKLSTLEKPIHPATFGWSIGALTEIADNKHANLSELRISDSALINDLFWRWVMNPSKSQDEILVRQSCIQEIIQRDGDSRELAAAFVHNITTFEKLQALLAHDQTGRIEKKLLAGDMSGVKTAIKEWFQSVSTLSDTLREIERYNSPLIFTAISDIRSCLETMPRPSTIDIDIALTGSPDPEMGRWIRQIFLPCYHHWNSDAGHLKTSIQLATLFQSAFAIQDESFCKVNFSDSEERFVNCWNGTLKQHRNDGSTQIKHSSTDDSPVTILKGGVMSGKTFALQRRLFLTLFAQTFGYAPGEEVTLRCYDNIHCVERGRTKSEENLSSFGSSQKAIARAFNPSSSQTLFISDELANETDRKSEDSLIYGIVRSLYESGAKVYVATHSKKATQALEQFPWTSVLHPKIIITTSGELDYHYILESGADESHALKVAQTLGLPQQILELMESYSRGNKLSISPPKHISSPKIPDTDSLWRGFGFIVHPGEPHYIDPNVSNAMRWDAHIHDQFELGTWELLFEKDTHPYGCWVDRRPRDNKGFSLFLTRDSDFGTAPRALNTNPFFLNSDTWYYRKVYPEDLFSSLTLRTYEEKNPREKPINRLPSFNDVEMRKKLILALQYPNKAQEIGHAVEALRITLYRWAELQSNGAHSNFYRYCNSLNKIAQRIAHGIENNEREENSDTLQERLIGLEALKEIIILTPSSKEKNEALGIVDFLINLTSISFSMYEDNNIVSRDESLAELFHKSLSLFSPESTLNRVELLNPLLRSWQFRSFIRQVENLLIEAEKVSPDVPLSSDESKQLVEIVTRHMKRLDSFVNSYELLYELASIRAYYDKVDPRESFIKLLESVDDKALHKQIEYIQNLLDMLFGDIHSQTDIKPENQRSLHPHGYELLSHQLSPLILFTQLAKHFKKEGYTTCTFGDDYTVNIGELYHPERVKSDYVPNDIYLPDTTRLFILRGPNMSGKSELLKALTWAFLSGRSVGFVNGSNVVLPKISRVVYLDRVSDSSGDGLSGWGTDIKNLKTLLEFVGTEPIDEHPALVVLNEFATSAPTEDQSAIKAAVAKLLIEAGHIVVYEGHDHEWIHRMTTECSDLCTTAHLSYEFDPTKNSDIRFTYKLINSDNDVPSYGIEVAKRVGLPPRAIELAREFASN